MADVHPDQFYKTSSSSDSGHACHSGSGSAGFYGAEKTDCDTPFTLVNATFEWIAKHLRDQIDYVIWTGDSARHDNDERRPRTEEQVVQLNEFVVQKFVEVFGKSDNIDDPDPTNDFVVPIVPTFGNNDILPHNIFREGPNRWTKKYTGIWRNFVPEAQRHSFQRGGWFFVEVIPNQLAVFSLNTLYFFENNAAVDGCNKKSQPGYEQMEWLRIQLQLLRNRGMKAIMIGHVPPARTDGKQSWYESCWQKYTLWMKQYRDVVAGSIYGHMDIDHFMIQDTKDLERYYTNGKEVEEIQRVGRFAAEDDPTFTTQGSSDYLRDLRDEWADLPNPPSGFSFVAEKHDGLIETGKRNKKKQKYLDKIGGEWAERFSVSLVSPSVVPNYYPSIRVIEYNISGIEDGAAALGDIPVFAKPTASTSEIAAEEHGDDIEAEKKRKKDKPKFKVPKAPSKSTPPGPAYSPQTFSFLSYAQYFANLTYINNGNQNSHAAADATKKYGPREFAFEVGYNTKNDTVYKLKDLTVKSYLDLAMRIGKKKGSESSLFDPAADNLDPDVEATVDASKHNKKRKKRKNKHKHKKGKKGKRQNKVWMAFVERAFVGAKSEEEIQEAFG